MCVGGSPSAPKPAAQLPQAPTAPAQPVRRGAMSEDERRRRAASGRAGSILTGPRGIEDTGTGVAAPAGQVKSLLGA